MKKLITILLTTAMLLTLAACGGDGGNNPSDDDNVNIREGEWIVEDEPQTAEPTAAPENLAGNNNAPHEIIEFGGYDWRVLETGDNVALLITDNIIERRVFHHSHENDYLIWADCDLRAYLNGEFLGGFSEEDRARIITVTNENRLDPWNADRWETWVYDEASGEYKDVSYEDFTDDNIFLLSLEEAVKYFGDSGQLNDSDYKNEISDEYNENRKAKDTEFISWWLRTSGSDGRNVWNVRGDGVMAHQFVLADLVGVRPALWLILDPGKPHTPPAPPAPPAPPLPPAEPLPTGINATPFNLPAPFETHDGDSDYFGVGSDEWFTDDYMVALRPFGDRTHYVAIFFGPNGDVTYVTEKIVFESEDAASEYCADRIGFFAAGKVAYREPIDFFFSPAGQNPFKSAQIGIDSPLRGNYTHIYLSKPEGFEQFVADGAVLVN